MLGREGGVRPPSKMADRKVSGSFQENKVWLVRRTREIVLVPTNIVEDKPIQHEGFRIRQFFDSRRRSVWAEWGGLGVGDHRGSYACQQMRRGPCGQSVHTNRQI
jgi:hypothetical protein